MPIQSGGGVTTIRHRDPIGFQPLRRILSPGTVQRSKNYLVTPAGKTLIPSHDVLSSRIPDTPLQQHFRQVELLPPIVTAVKANGIHSPTFAQARVDYKLYSGTIPFPGVGQIQHAHTPPLLLSTPINVTTNNLAYGPTPSFQTPGPTLNIVPWEKRKPLRRVVNANK